MKASGLARPGGGRPLGRASSCPEASREPAVSANTGPSRPLEALRRRLGALRAVRGRPRPSLCGGSPFRTYVGHVRRTGPTGRRGPQGGRASGGKSALEAPAAVAVGASVRHLLGHLPPLGFEILPPLPRRISRGRPVGVADSRLVRRVRRQLPLGYYRRRALQPPEAGALQPVLPVELLQRPALHLGRIGPGGSERPADLALPCIDMFPIWDTLSANKTGRCPKWPRPK